MEVGAVCRNSRGFGNSCRRRRGAREGENIQAQPLCSPSESLRRREGKGRKGERGEPPPFSDVLQDELGLQDYLLEPILAS